MNLSEALDVALDIRRGTKRLADVALEDRAAVRTALNDETLLSAHARSKESSRATRFTFARPRNAVV